MDNKNEEFKGKNYKSNLEHIKNKFILKLIFSKIKRNKYLEIIKPSKKVQNKLDINIKDYKDYTEIFSTIDIEMIPSENKFGKFINISKQEEKKYYHIYFNDNKEEIQRYSLNEKDNVKYIRIIIDYQVTSFYKLFNECSSIESINFKKFYRKNITDMSYMFNKCNSLKNINFSKFNTDNTFNMSNMFYGCSSLEELDLSNFNTNNVSDMSKMFCKCSSLKKINLSNFITNKVIDMSFMFLACSSLEDLNISNFNMNNVTDMTWMFNGCKSELKKKIAIQNNDIEDEAF